MRILGIDPSTRTGIAVVETGKKIIHTEEIEFRKLDGFERIQAIATRLFEIKDEFKPDHIVIEGMFVGAAASAVIVIQVASILRFYLWQESIKYLEVSPGTLKKFVANSGAAKKEQMMMCVLKNWGYSSETNNIADAIGLAMFGLCYFGEKFSAAQNAVVLGLKDKETKGAKKASKV